VDSKEKHSVKLSKKVTVALLAVLSILDCVSQIQKPPSAAVLETRTDPRSGLKFVRLPKRQYPELRPLSEKQSEKAQDREIAVGPIWMATTDVTVAAYVKCTKTNACPTDPASSD
jgi:hypothetical protein